MPREVHPFFPSEKGRLMICLPHTAALFVMLLTQTPGHKMAALMAPFSQLSNITFHKQDEALTKNNNNNGNLESTYPAAQSAEQAYTGNVHRDGKCYPQK